MVALFSVEYSESGFIWLHLLQWNTQKVTEVVALFQWSAQKVNLNSCFFSGPLRKWFYVVAFLKWCDWRVVTCSCFFTVE